MKRQHDPTDPVPPAKRPCLGPAPSLLDALIDDVLRLLYRNYLHTHGRIVLRLTHRAFAAFVETGDSPRPHPASVWEYWFGRYRDFARDGWPAYPKLNVWRETPEVLWVAAIVENRLTTLDWLRREGWPWKSEILCRAAIYKGQLSVLDWLLARGMLAPSLATKAEHFMNNAVLAGQLKVMQWIRLRSESARCFDEDTMWFAILVDRRDLMEWLHEHGCSFDLNAFIQLVSGEVDRRSLMQWVVDRLGPHEPHPGVLRSALCHGNMLHVQWLYDRGWPLPRLFRAECSPAAVAWLESVGYVFS